MLDMPGELISEYGLRIGDTVAIGVEDDRIVIHKSTRPLYTLRALIEQCNDSLPIDEEDRRWLDSKPTGREIL